MVVVKDKMEGIDQMVSAMDAPLEQLRWYVPCGQVLDNVKGVVSDEQRVSSGDRDAKLMV